MQLKVKDVISALSKVDENEIVYIEASFGGSDIHVSYDVVQLENGRVIIKGDGHCSDFDREGTEFDFELKETELLESETNND